ncbi:MAG: YfjI family protein [Nitrospira sp.]
MNADVEAIVKQSEAVMNGVATVETASMSGMSVQSSDVWPEIQAVKDELPPVPALPFKMVPPVFRPWVKDVADRMQCPPDYVAAAAIVSVGSLIGAGCGLRPKKNDDWIVVPNLWGGVVARPSMLKTPAISEAMKPLDGLEYAAKLAHDTDKNNHEAEYEVYRARKESLQADMRKVAHGKGKTGQTMDGLKKAFAELKEPTPPVWRRYKTNDPTIEKMSELQAANNRGLLLFRDELIGFFATCEKDGHEADRAYYLESWNGVHPYTSDRIGRGTTYVENLCVSLFGSIQPTKLSTHLHAAMRGHNNDGLVQRLQVLVYPDEPATWTLIDTPINISARQVAHDAVKRLAGMDFRQYGAFGDEGERIPYYRFDDEGQQVFYRWWAELETKLRSQEDEPVVLEHLGKYRSLMPSLALIFHLLEVASTPHAPHQVSAHHAECAAAWCGYLEEHARRIYSLVTNATQRAAKRLAGKLQQGCLPNPFTVRDVYRKDWSLLNERDLVEKACEELVALGWLKEQVTPSAPGQRGKTEYLISPKVKPNG